VGGDPGDEVRGLGIDTRVASLSTAICPGHNSRQLVATHEGTAGVTLAGVLTAGIITSAEHGVSDITLAIGFAAVIIRHNRDIHLMAKMSQLNSLLNKHNIFCEENIKFLLIYWTIVCLI
jgi:hypothetical protein